MDMFTVTVGEPYGGTPRSWAETAHLSWHHGQYEFVISLSKPQSEEIEAVRRKPLQLAACRYHNVLTWGWRFGDLPWGDCSYSWHLQKTHDPSLPLPSAEPVPRPLCVILIEADQGIVQCIRVIALPVFFVQAWERAVIKQAREEWSENDYDARLQMLYGAFATERMVKKLAFVSCRIGPDPVPGRAASGLN